MSVIKQSVRLAYDAVARLLHWIVVVLVAAQFIIGWTMPEVHRDTLPEGLIAWHLTVGAVLIVLHVGAAFYHRFVLKDDVLRRML